MGAYDLPGTIKSMGLKSVRRAEMSSRHHPLIRGLVGHVHFNMKPMRLQTGAIQVGYIIGAPTGGTFYLHYANQTTTGLAYNASAATVQSALEALPAIGVGGVSVGLSGSTYTFTLAVADPSAISATTSGFTGGTTPHIIFNRDVYSNRGFNFTPPGGNAIWKSTAFTASPAIRPGRTGIAANRTRSGGNFEVNLGRIPPGWLSQKGTVLGHVMSDNWQTTQNETFFAAFCLESSGGIDHGLLFAAGANGAGNNLRLVISDEAGNNDTNINTVGTAGKPAIVNHLGTRPRICGFRFRPGTTRVQAQVVHAGGMCYGDEGFGSVPVQCSSWTELSGGALSGLSLSQRISILNGQGLVEFVLAWDKTLTDAQIRTVMRQPYVIFRGNPMMGAE